MADSSWISGPNPVEAAEMFRLRSMLFKVIVEIMGVIGGRSKMATLRPIRFTKGGGPTIENQYDTQCCGGRKMNFRP